MVMVMVMVVFGSAVGDKEKEKSCPSNHHLVWAEVSCKEP